VYQVKPRSYTDLRHIGLMAFNSKVENYTVWKIINSGPPSALHDRDEGPLRWVVVKAPGATPWGAWGKSGEGKGGRGKGVCPSNFYRCPHFLIPGVAPERLCVAKRRRTVMWKYGSMGAKWTGSMWKLELTRFPDPIRPTRRESGSFAMTGRYFVFGTGGDISWGTCK